MKEIRKCFSNWYGGEEGLLFFSEIKKYLATVVYFGGVLWLLKKKKQSVPFIYSRAKLLGSSSQRLYY